MIDEWLSCDTTEHAIQVPWRFECTDDRLLFTCNIFCLDTCTRELYLTMLGFGVMCTTSKLPNSYRLFSSLLMIHMSRILIQRSGGHRWRLTKWIVWELALENWWCLSLCLEFEFQWPRTWKLKSQLLYRVRNWWHRYNDYWICLKVEYWRHNVVNTRKSLCCRRFSSRFLTCVVVSQNVRFSGYMLDVTNTKPILRNQCVPDYDTNNFNVVRHDPTMILSLLCVACQDSRRNMSSKSLSPNKNGKRARSSLHQILKYQIYWPRKCSQPYLVLTSNC